MPVTFNAAGALAVNNTTVTLPVVAPTLSAGDLMICCLINKSVTANTISPPDGTWTTVIAQEVNDCTTAADDHSFVIFAKFASAGDSGATFNFTKATDDNLLFAGVISAWTGAAGFDATPAARSLNTAAADAVTFPAYDPVVACHVVFVAFYGNDLTTFAAAMSSDTNPDCTVRFDLETATGNDTTIACTSGDNTDGANIASRTWASVSTTDAGSTGVVFGLVAGISGNASEALTISGSGRVDLIDLLAPRLHLTDGPVVAALTGGANLSATLTSESLKVSESATLQLTPLLASVSEAARVTDSVTAREDPLQASVTDGLRVSDAVSSTLTPLLASSTEALKVVDAASASLGTLVVVASESLTIADVILTSLDPLRATPGESLRVGDGPGSASLGTLVVSLVESSRLSDNVSASETPLLAVVAAESLRLIDLNQGGIEIEHAIRITDGPVIAELVANVFSATLSESVRLTDTAVATITPVLVTMTESVKVTDGPLSASLGTLIVGVGPESLRLSDAVSVTLTPLHATTTESVAVVDGPTVASLGGLVVVVSSESIRLSDLALTTLDPVETILGETVRVVDGPATASYDQLSASSTEAILLSEIIASVLDPLQVGVSVESLRVADDAPPAAYLSTDLSLSLTESVRIIDFNYGLVQLYGVLHISDGPVVATLVFEDLAVAGLTEAIALAETVAVSLDALQATPASESIVVSDTSVVSLDPLHATTTEAVRVDDGPVVVSLGALVVSVAVESLRVQDTVASTLNPLETASVSELLHLTDVSVSPVLTPLQGVLAEAIALVDGPVTAAQVGGLVIVLSESLRLTDTVSVTLTPIRVIATEAVSVVDGPVQSSLGQLGTSVAEALRMTEAIVSVLTPLQAVVSESITLGWDVNSGAELVSLETVTIVDTTPTAELVISGTVSVTETLKLSDVASVTLDPLATSTPSEALKVSDSLSVLLDLSVALTEALRVVDTVSASLISMGQLQASPSEALVVVDTIAAQTSLLSSSVSESVRVQDALAASLGLLGASATEAVRCQDVVSVAIDPVVLATESLKVGDTVTARIDPLRIEAGEAVRLADVTAQASLSFLQAIASESLRVQETLNLGVDLLSVSLTDTVYCLDAASVVFHVFVTQPRIIGLPASAGPIELPASAGTIELPSSV